MIVTVWSGDLSPSSQSPGPGPGPSQVQELTEAGGTDQLQLLGINGCHIFFSRWVQKPKLFRRDVFSIRGLGGGWVIKLTYTLVQITKQGEGGKTRRGRPR